MSYKVYNEYGTKIHVYEFNPKEERFAYELGVNMKLETINKLPRPKDDEEVICVINWNFFDWQKSFNGYGEIEQYGKQIQPPSIAFPSFSFKDDKMVFGDLENADIGAGVGVVLILDGKINIINKAKVSTNKDARTVVAQKANNNIIVAICEGDDTKKKGLSSKEFAEFLLRLGCVIAFQGDSGGSTSMMINGKYVYNQGRAIACGFCVYKKKSQVSSDNVNIDISKFPVLRKGSRGEYVKILQSRLIELGYDLGKWGSDGDLGATSEKAIIAFQKDVGFTGRDIDGICGFKTWSKLFI